MKKEVNCVFSLLVFHVVWWYNRSLGYSIYYLLYHVDVNECELGDVDCATNATCSNTDGSYVCSCNTGFTGDGKHCSKFYLFMLYQKNYDSCLSVMCITSLLLFRK